MIGINYKVVYINRMNFMFNWKKLGINKCDISKKKNLIFLFYLNLLCPILNK